MIITEITRQKNDQSRYSVFIDGQFAFGLVMEDIAYFKLKEGSEISQETYEYISEKLVYIKAQDTALNFIGYKMRTASQVRNKLLHLEFSEAVVEQVLEFLIKYKYVDDLDYSRRYIRERERLNPRGTYAIKAELRQKGIAENIILLALENEEIDETASARRVIEKKCRYLEVIDEKEKKRLCGFLQRKGYSYDIIKEVLKGYEKPDD